MTALPMAAQMVGWKEQMGVQADGEQQAACRFITLLFVDSNRTPISVDGSSACRSGVRR
jgi:hypothetical protein